MEHRHTYDQSCEHCEHIMERIDALAAFNLGAI